MGKINELEKEAAGMEQKVEKKLFSVVVMKSLNITFSIAMAVMFIFSLVFIENVHPYFMSSFIYLLSEDDLLDGSLGTVIDLGNFCLFCLSWDLTFGIISIIFLPFM